MAHNKGELLRRQRLLEQASAEVRRELVQVLTVLATGRGGADPLWKRARNLEARMIALERELGEIRAGLVADVNAIRRAERSALWSA